MENGSFHHLDKLNFAEDIADEFSNFKPQSLSFNEPAPRKSGTVDALIAQNEDITARLKIAMRRMTMLEDENNQLIKELNETKISYSSTSDQMLVWKEKEKIWKERNEQAETALQAFRDRFTDYLGMEAKVEKLTRYQERVKTTIKPYLQQLKDYAQSLHLQIQGQNAEIEMRDTQLVDKDRQLLALKEKFEDQVRFYEMNQNDLVASFEKEKDFYQHEITILNENLALAEEKSQRLNAALQRQDELENLVISLRRNKDDFYNGIQEELESLRSFNSEAKKDLIERDLLNQNLRKELDSLKAQFQDTANKKQDLEEQLTSLRYMWSEQSLEKEKMEISISSLEKLNLELSTKLSELRRKI